MFIDLVFPCGSTVFQRLSNQAFPGMVMVKKLVRSPIVNLVIILQVFPDG